MRNHKKEKAAENKNGGNGRKRLFDLKHLEIFPAILLKPKTVDVYLRQLAVEAKVSLIKNIDKVCNRKYEKKSNHILSGISIPIVSSAAVKDFLTISAVTNKTDLLTLFSSTKIL